MPYTNKSLAFVWLGAIGVFALTGSGVIAGSWLLLLLPVAFAAPALILRSPAGAPAASHERRSVVADKRDRSTFLSGTEVHRWENDGGARVHVSSGSRRRKTP